MYAFVKEIVKPLVMPFLSIRSRIVMGMWWRYVMLYCDQQSLDILEARAKYVPWLKLFEFSNRIMEIQRADYWRLAGGLKDVKNIVVYGKGNGYKYTCSLIQRSNYEGKYRFIGDNEDLISGISADESLLVACGRNRYSKTVKQIKNKYPSVNVLEDYDICLGTIGNQYFDVFTPKQNEVIIDAGAYDGTTEEKFFEWGKDCIDRIYAFELDPRNAEKCMSTFRNNGYDNVVFINKGVANENKTIHLATGNQSSASSKRGKGGQEAYICRIDDEISDRVTFIKMDIEGEELNALKGAERTIREYKPRLAICIYHKPSDLYKIPGYLHKIVPEYKFVVRHYTSIEWETVLYAWV
ncbi:MAG: FkbM family methyltransferase [Lachnospiraceae bacterium]|nr:FkbM family methyltransferase [Lachnospiraceae bacterium]